MTLSDCLAVFSLSIPHPTSYVLWILHLSIFVPPKQPQHPFNILSILHSVAACFNQPYPSIKTSHISTLNLAIFYSETMKAQQLDSTDLKTPPNPVSISEPSFTKAETSMTLRCQDNLFRKCTVIGEAGETLFTIESPGWSSYSWRRAVRDASGRQIFELRRYCLLGVLATAWRIEGPDGEDLGTVSHNKTLLNPERSSLNMSLRNTAADDDKNNKKAVVEIRQVDMMAKKTLVKMDGITVADIIALENNDWTSFVTGEVRSVWKSRVAEGVDLKIVSFDSKLVYLIKGDKSNRYLCIIDFNRYALSCGATSFVVAVSYGMIAITS